ncbi:MAG: TetR/AcrR family transcriptional regulator [Myxococcota bacterium]|nr:TetR/AcrR family transcriptional regulator [Myxococcota bacterium]
MATRGKRDIRQHMLRTAVGLFRKQGYEQTSMLDVVRESGAPRGSLYHYFPGGKTQMGREAVDLASRAVLAWMRAARAASSSAPQFIDRLGRAYREALLASEFAEGCPIATVALETAAVVPEVSDSCGDGFASWVDEATEALVEHGLPRRKARPLAIHCVSAIEGALILSRSARDLEPLDTVIRQLKRLVSES